MWWVLLSLAGAAMADYCPKHHNARIQECVQPVAEYAKTLNNNQEPGAAAFALPNMSKQLFAKLCKHVETFNYCVKDMRATCPRHVTIGLIDSSYGYLCSDGHAVFLDSAECLMELDRKPAVKTCHDETLSKISSANVDPPLGINERVDIMCGALNYFSQCVRLPIRTECGGSAWQVIFRVLKDTTKTLMPGCVFGGTSARIQVGSLSSSTIDSGVAAYTNRQPKRRTSTTTTTPTALVSRVDYVVETEEESYGKSLRQSAFPADAAMGKIVGAEGESALYSSLPSTNLSSSSPSLLFIPFLFSFYRWLNR